MSHSSSRILDISCGRGNQATNSSQRNPGNAMENSLNSYKRKSQVPHPSLSNPDSKKVELINYSHIASETQKPRESIELTFKEITLRIMQLVLQDTAVCITLNCSDMGVLQIQTKPLQFKLKKVQAVVLPCVVKQETVGVEMEIKAIARDLGLTCSKMLDVKLPDATSTSTQTNTSGISATSTVRFIVPETLEERPKTSDSDVSDLTVEGSDEWPRFVIRSRITHSKKYN